MEIKNFFLLLSLSCLTAYAAQGGAGSQSEDLDLEELKKIEGIGYPEHPWQEQKWDTAALLSDKKYFEQHQKAYKNRLLQMLRLQKKSPNDFFIKMASPELQYMFALTEELAQPRQRELARVLVKAEKNWLGRALVYLGLKKTSDPAYWFEHMTEEQANHLLNLKKDIFEAIFRTLPLAVFTPQQEPFKDKKIFFQGVVHEPGFLQLAFWPAIQKIFKEERPDICILEMVPTHLGENSSKMVDRNKELDEVSIEKIPELPMITESDITTYFARKNGASIIGGEPHNATLVTKSTDDERIAWLLHGGSMHNELNFKFNWMPKYYDLYNISEDETKKIQEAIRDKNKNAEYLMHMQEERDKNLTNVILNAAADPKHKTILVVYGVKHLDSTLPVLKQYLGQPKIMTVAEYLNESKAF